ncbi:MAG: riboflavin synthase subunit alpha [Planctomycetes bacterium RBG_13_50_24]|nr:MAG: riboflavin synthase subunit alpha [Planctomycetes bacterium RBG_13_50_24]
MFTGLIETICIVKSVRRSAESMVLTIDLGAFADESKIGDSIAINGACLTISKLQGSLASFDVSAETLAKSTLGKLKPSSEVNVERSLKASDRFGGHFVLGHVDGTASIDAIDKSGEFANIKFAAKAELLDAIVHKGSVAVDGISLTIAAVDVKSFGVSVIPETLKRTTLGRAKIGDCVNIETDIIVKTIKKQLDKILPKKQGLTAEKLRQLGY